MAPDRFGIAGTTVASNPFVSLAAARGGVPTCKVAPMTDMSPDPADDASTTAAVSPGAGAPPGGDAPVLPEPTATGRPWTRILAVIAAAVVLWGVAAAILLAMGRSDMVQAEETLRGARDSVEDLDLETTATAVSMANADLARAARSLSNPVLLPLTAAPVVGEDLRAVRALATNGAEVTAATEEAIEIVTSMPEGLRSLAPDDGRFPVERYAELAPAVQGVARTGATAVDEIAANPGSGRFDQVIEARERVLDLLTPLSDQAETAAALSAELPRFLGSDGPRTYLFGASTPAELRGTGGFVGSVALLRVDQGALEFGTFEASNSLPDLPPDLLPPPAPDDAVRWSRYGGTGFFVNLNRTPDFPTAAQAMLAHWRETQGTTLDGMVVVDPFAFEALLELSGPTEVADYGVTLDANSVVAFVANEAYDAFDDPTERKEVLGDVAAATFGRFLAGDAEVPMEAALSRFAALVQGGHLLAYATDTTTQSALDLAGVTGRLGPDETFAHGDVVNVVMNSGTGSKVDFYAHREVTIETTLLADGSASSELLVRLANDAPTTGAPKYVIGPNNPTLDAGDNLVDVSVYLTPTASFTEVPPRADGPTYLETSLGHPVHDGWVRIPSGSSTERRYAWRTDDAWSVTDDNELAYDLLFQGQTVIQPTRLSIRIDVPDGLEVVSPPEGARVEGSTLLWQGDIRGDDVHLPLRLIRPSDP